jgi:LysR family transcriptional regulator of abg operon
MFSSTKLRQVVGVDRAGSFSKASDALNISQSTLTKAVADVEVVLGYTLFLRSARGVSATPEGREFLTRAARIVADFDLLIEDARFNRQSSDQKLRVGVSPATLEGFFNRPVALLLKRRPDICLTISGVPSDRGIDLLKRGDIDLLFGPMETLQRENDLTVEPVHNVSMQLFARKDHPIADIAYPTVDDMRPYKFVTSDLYEIFGAQIRDFLDENGGDVTDKIHVINNFSIIMEVVAQTDCLSVVSGNYAGSQSFRERFFLIDLDFFDPMEFGMARLSKWLPSRSASTFEQIVKKSLGSASVL